MAWRGTTRDMARTRRCGSMVAMHQGDVKPDGLRTEHEADSDPVPAYPSVRGIEGSDSHPNRSMHAYRLRAYRLPVARFQSSSQK